MHFKPLLVAGIILLVAPQWNYVRAITPHPAHISSLVIISDNGEQSSAVLVSTAAGHRQ